MPCLSLHHRRHFPISRGATTPKLKNACVRLSVLTNAPLAVSVPLSLSLLWFLRGFGLGKLIHPHSPWFVHIFQWNMISMAQTPKNRAESRSPHHCVSVSVSVSASVSVSVSVCVCATCKTCLSHADGAGVVRVMLFQEVLNHLA